MISKITRVVTLALCFAISVVCYATGDGKALRYGGAGQGTVIFDGKIHAAAGYVCTDCHNDLFETHKTARISMEDHSSNTSCFACHNEKIAPNECSFCHRQVDPSKAAK